MTHPLVKKFLTHDSYIKSTIEKSLSASRLMTSTQELILSKHYPENKIDFFLNAASAIGTGFHLYGEEAIPKGFKFEYNGDTYILFKQELSMNHPVGHGFTITGTSDMVFQKNKKCLHIADFKTVKDYGLKSNPSKWSIQLSIYNWLASKWFNKPGDSTGTVLYFNKTAEASGKTKKIMDVMTLDLMSMQETEDFIERKVLEVSKYWDISKDELHKLPLCTNDENWNNRKCNSYCPHIGICPQINNIANGNYSFKL